MKFELVVAGVGGQGSILASHLIAEAAIAHLERTGKPGSVRVGETFGAAMRGGAVASHVRVGQAEGPLIAEGRADVVLALEPLEGLRVGCRYLGPGSLAVLNTHPVPPVDVKIGAACYPELGEIQSALEGLGAEVRWIAASKLANEAGDARTTNVVMLGALFGTGRLPLHEQDLVEVISKRVPPKTVDKNLKAFELGKRAGWIGSDGLGGASPASGSPGGAGRRSPARGDRE